MSSVCSGINPLSHTTIPGARGAYREPGVSLAALPMTPAALGGLIRLVDAGTITSPVAKVVFEEMLASGRPADMARMPEMAQKLTHCPG